jgi:hypothetical protein
VNKWQQGAQQATTAVKPVAALVVIGVHGAWLVPLVLGMRLALVSVVALVMVLSVGKGKRVEAIKAVPSVIDALLGREAR